MRGSVCRCLLGLTVLTHYHATLSLENTITVGLLSVPPLLVHLSLIPYSRNTILSAAVDSVALKFPLAFIALPRFARCTFSLSHDSHVALSAFTGIHFGRGPSV